MDIQMSQKSGGSVAFIMGIAALLCIAGAKPIGMTHAYLAHAIRINSLMSYGLCNGPCRVAEDILRNRYGVVSIPVAGCVVWGPEVWYSDGYNHVARSLIVREQGRDVFREAYDEAFRKYSEAHRREDRGKH